MQSLIGQWNMYPIVHAQPHLPPPPWMDFPLPTALFSDFQRHIQPPPHRLLPVVAASLDPCGDLGVDRERVGSGGHGSDSPILGKYHYSMLFSFTWGMQLRGLHYIIMVLNYQALQSSWEAHKGRRNAFTSLRVQAWRQLIITPRV